jgi:coproporphyrinogen III oxidase-like Fe-S oxidoreductase
MKKDNPTKQSNKLKPMLNNGLVYSTSSLTDKFGISNVNNDIKLGLIKVCVQPECESLYHNCPFEVKRCEFCGGSIKMINQETYFKKFSDRFFQYDQPTGEYLRPRKIKPQYSLDVDC